ncbi:MAG: T9SS type A sorting domain-containing protein [Bacteroidetes bacterium]|nr:T9SS type A sorting domain-containing protein [Bacteroidota bacterium]
MHSSDENPSKENTKNNNIAEFVHSKLESAVIVHAYPNPVSDQLTVEFDTPVTVTILLMNASNNYLVEEKISNKKTLTIDASNFTTGIYSLHVIGEKINTVLRIGIVK